MWLHWRDHSFMRRWTLEARPIFRRMRGLGLLLLLLLLLGLGGEEDVANGDVRSRPGIRTPGRRRPVGEGRRVEG